MDFAVIRGLYSHYVKLFYCHKKSMLAINTRTSDVIPQKSDCGLRWRTKVIGDEFKYLPYLTLTLAYLRGSKIENWSHPLNETRKGDSLLPVNFTSCPLINAIIITLWWWVLKYDKGGSEHRKNGKQQHWRIRRDDDNNNNINNNIFYSFSTFTNQIKGFLWDFLKSMKFIRD